MPAAPVTATVITLNEARHIEACLASLRTLNYPNYEVVVVNDGSTDRTLAITEQYEALYRADPDGPRMIVVVRPSEAPKSGPMPMRCASSCRRVSPSPVSSTR